MNIGLLEGNPAIMDYMVQLLTMAGHEVYPHTQGESLLYALAAAFRTRTHIPYDVLVVDILLPGALSGTDIIVELRQWLSPEELPIIVVSACGRAELEKIEATFPDIRTLRKPFKIHTLLQLIEQAEVL